MPETAEEPTVSAEPAKPAKKPANRRPTARQRKLMTLMLQVEDGKMTIGQAMKQAGYSDESARQQSNVLGDLRKNTVMQEALRKVGFTEEKIAEKVAEGIEAKKRVAVRKGDKVVLVQEPDLDVAHKYLKTGAELMDAFPATKNINASADLADLIKAQEATTPPDAGNTGS